MYTPSYTARLRAEHFTPDPYEPKAACNSRISFGTPTTRYVTCERCKRTTAYKERHAELEARGVRF